MSGGLAAPPFPPNREIREGDLPARAAPPIADPVVAPWESTRCRCCTRLLCKNTRDALKPECVIEIKCGNCKTLNYLMGRPE